MSAGNACAAIGLANTFKIPMIGGYVQDLGVPPGPGAEGPHIGVTGSSTSNNGLNGTAYWDRNVMGEDNVAGYTVPAASGVATGKVATWVSTGASPVTVPADGRVTITAGVIVAAAGTGLSKTYIAPTTVIPAGSFLWVYLI
jgi:hypothetical protein